MTVEAGGWEGTRVCVAGVGISGVPAARALLARGAVVTVVDGRDGEDERRRGVELEQLGVEVRLGAGEQLPAGTEVVITSPGWRPTAPLLTAAAGSGVPVLGEAELAWALRGAGPGRPAPWLALTGTNGKTSTVRMLAAILSAAGLRAQAAGNVGVPLVEAVLADPPYEALAVELSSFQLHWSRNIRPFAAAVLNVAPDHIDWHGSFEDYAADKGRIYAGDPVAVYNADDFWSARLAAGCPRRFGFTLGAPGPGELGVEGECLVDRAFAAGLRREPRKLAATAEVRPPAPHNVSNALAAAGLALAYGVPPAAVRAGLLAFRPDPHRAAPVTTVRGVHYVDDSKATNPHAAAASLAACASVVWIAGGQLKGAAVDDVVAAAGDRLRGAVLMGEDRAAIRGALGRHAPDIPVVELASTDTGAMRHAVREAARLAYPGDTVLLAPAGASFDMFTGYSARGDAFAAAVRLLAEGRL